MGDIVQFEHRVELTAVEFTCGHQVYLTHQTVMRRRADDKPLWCPHCGTTNGLGVPKPKPPPKISVVGKIALLFPRRK